MLKTIVTIVVKTLNNMIDHATTHLFATRVERERSILQQAWACVCHDHDAYYISGPITTGARYLQWHANIGKSLSDADQYNLSHRQHVIDPNTGDLRLAAIQLRKSTNRLVIEPGGLYMPAWSQSDYLILWKSVFQRFVERIVLLDGWQYSVGCICELKQAMDFKLPIEDTKGESLTYELCLKIVREAVGVVQGTHLSYSAQLEKALYCTI